MIIECENHEGRFDCTPFCRTCEGFQEYDSITGEPPVYEDYETSGVPTAITKEWSLV